MAQNAPTLRAHLSARQKGHYGKQWLPEQLSPCHPVQRRNSELKLADVSLVIEPDANLLAGLRRLAAPNAVAVFVQLWAMDECAATTLAATRKNGSIRSWHSSILSLLRVVGAVAQGHALVPLHSDFDRLRPSEP